MTLLGPARRRAILWARCPVCLVGPMFSGVIHLRERCPHCGHRFEREPGYFQGAMFVSYGLGVVLFVVLGIVADLMLARRLGFALALAVAFAAYLLAVPVLLRYSRVIWAHLFIGTVQTK